MLFAIKNRWLPSLLLLGAFVLGALIARDALDLRWQVRPYPGLARHVALGFGLILASDGLLHGALALALGKRYLAHYHALAAYFRPQGAPEIAAGGLLAGGEELIFRGVLLEGLMTRAGAGPVVAIVVAALAFGALHTLRAPELAPFALWAVWEGLLLGAFYVATGSLLAAALVHMAHDILGFILLAHTRRSAA